MFISQDSVDYAAIGASSKLAAILMTYPFQVGILFWSSVLFMVPKIIIIIIILRSLVYVYVIC